MSIRTKVLLFACVALGLVTLMGAVLYRSASRTHTLRSRLATTSKQLGIYAEMHHQAWDFLERLLHARRTGNDTRELLSAHERLIQEDLQALEEGLRMEQQWADVQGDSREQQHIEAIHQTRRKWAERVEAVVRSETTVASFAPEVGWGLFAEFEREVSPHIEQAEATRHAKLLSLQALLDQNVELARQVGKTAPLVSSVLLGLLAVLILVPMHRELRALRAGAERLGHGDFTVELPARRQDELGSLAQAFNRMARELRESLREKEQRMKAEAEAAEREFRQDAEMVARDFRRYNASLEQMVRTRTAELESANARLEASLKQLQAMQAQLMFTDRLAAMGRLAAGVGHEINNPLAYVVSNLNYLHKELHRTQGAPSEEDRQELLTVVAEAKEGAERVRVIVQDLKTLSRPDDASNGLADVKAVVRSAVKIASHEIRRRARLVEELGAVPPVRGNAARLGQVFLNLLINAAQAIPEGHVEENEIRVTAWQEEPGRVTVEVSDTGCGIPAENLKHIFDPFFTTKPVGEGTGLGLSLCHSIITALGGTITVESQVHRGTTFRVSLPAMKPLD